MRTRGRRRNENGNNVQCSFLAKGQKVESPEGIQSATGVEVVILEHVSKLWMGKEKGNESRCWTKGSYGIDLCQAAGIRFSPGTG